MAISYSTMLRNKLLSQSNSAKFQMAVVSDLSEDLIINRIKSGNFEISIITSCDNKFFRDQNGKRYVYAVGIDETGRIFGA